MRAFVMTPERLKHEGYKLENLGKDEVLAFRRCRDCHGLSPFFSFFLIRRVVVSGADAEQVEYGRESR